MTVGGNHATAMDAASYWKQYAVQVDFLEPGEEVAGEVVHLGEIKGRDGEMIPQLRIRQASGVVAIVTAGPKRLLAELVRLGPAVGDRVRIKYFGEEEHAPPGLSPTRRFKVAVRRPGEALPPNWPAT